MVGDSLYITRQTAEWPTADVVHLLRFQLEHNHLNARGRQRAQDFLRAVAAEPPLPPAPPAGSDWRG